MEEARRSGAVIVIDRTLVSFVEYERLRRGIPFTVLKDSQIGTDTLPPPQWATVAVHDAGHGGFVADARVFQVFPCKDRWLRRLSQGRFLEITVASEAQIVDNHPAQPNQQRRRP